MSGMSMHGSDWMPLGGIDQRRLSEARLQAHYAVQWLGRAARAYVLQSMAEIWKHLCAGSMITVSQRISVRVASTNAIHKARDAVDFAYNAAGATAIFNENPFERRFRDIHSVAQQLQGRQQHFETVGQYLMGLEADTGWL